MTKIQIKEEIKKTNEEITNTNSPLRKNDLYRHLKKLYIKLHKAGG